MKTLILLTLTLCAAWLLIVVLALIVLAYLCHKDGYPLIAAEPKVTK